VENNTDKRKAEENHRCKKSSNKNLKNVIKRKKRDKNLKKNVCKRNKKLYFFLV